jgi:DNA mismatch repair protein MutS
MKKNPMAKLISQISDSSGKLISQISDSSGKLISQISDSSVNSSTIQPQNIYDKYSDYAKHYTEIYGNRVAILMMVGSFYEIYGQRSDPCFAEIVSVCQLNTSEKKNVSIFMAGFPEYTLEKYLQLLSGANFTSVVIVQDEDTGSGGTKGAKKKHSVLSIYSPGTYVPISVETSSAGTGVSSTSNNIMCVWLSTYVPLHKTKSNIVCGISILNMFTGKSHLAEHIMPFENNATTFDEIERLVSVHNPCEVIFLYDLATVCSVGTSVGTSAVDASASKTLESKLMKRVKTYCGVTCDCVHEHHIRSLSAAQNCEKTQYLTYTLESVFGTESYSTISEFHLYPTATKSYCFLLNFVKEHNPALIQKICAPTFANAGSNAVLANHALKQLNIIDDHSTDSARSGHLSSVLSFLNRACTTIGRRRIKEMMTTPTFDEEWLNREYDIVEAMMMTNNYDMMMFCRKQLTTVIDLEKVLRQIVLKRVPTGIIKPLYDSLFQVQQMDICLKELGPLTEYLKLVRRTDGHNSTKPNIDCVCDFILKAIEAHIEMSKIDENGALNIFKKGIDADMDRMVAEYAEVTAHIDAIQGFFNMIMRSSSNSASNDDTEYVKICSTEKSGSTMQLTKTRAKTLKHLLEKKEYLVAPWYKTIEATGKFRGIPINFVADVKFKGASTNNDEIVFDQLARLFARSFQLELSIARRNSELYASFVSDVLDGKCFASIEAVVDYVRIIDVLQCRVYVAKKYKYCRPVIDATHDRNSYMKATGLRHVLIEHIQQHELYVANDVTLDSGGILLYGTNAVGKTSLIRSIGIAAIMAQTGFFVPCTEFVYKPYRAFFTRILGVDNLYKGLSTFGVEMSELRMILKNADEYSLILGDELCSGTETQSALSIFVAGLMDLHAAQSSFIFATHFHEIVDYEEITELKRLEMKHMAVFYDRENDCLVYDRTLRDGAGDKMYGLEVCKSLHLPTEFLEKAFKIRSKYFSDVAVPLNYKTTKYNAKKVRGMCEMCETRISTETHHLAMQMNAEAEGIINKNHAGNLMALCEACHQEMHTTTETTKPESTKAESIKTEPMVYYKTVKKVVKKKTTIGHMPYLKDN